ncbi:hypothetical protein JCM10207_003798 [Rhodosporidiobolus poonsookiae]
MASNAGSVASSSRATLDNDDRGEADQTYEGGRMKRSRRDRPCDACRKSKHYCVIQVRGEPCKACKLRGQACTFVEPPTARVRKGRGDTAQPDPSSAAMQDAVHGLRLLSGGAEAFSAGELFAMQDSPSPALASVLSTIRTARRPRPAAATASTAEPSTVHPLASNMHYVNPHVFSDLTFSTTSDPSPGEIASRQVSTDPTLQSHFIQTPLLVYGRTLHSPKQVWNAAVRGLSSDALRKLAETFMRETQPACPILNEQQLSSTDTAELAKAGVPYSVLTSLLAHATTYIPDSRLFHKTLWRHALALVEDEYRTPTLHTVQVALIALTARPALNIGVNHIAMSRLVGAAQLLGLHLDSTHWDIPPAEKALRKKLWWLVLMQDKWRGLTYGRSSNISFNDCNVPLPSLDDFHDAPTPAETASYESFIAMCKLSVIIDSVLSEFFSVRAMSLRRTPESQLSILEDIVTRLARLERYLPEMLQQLPEPENAAEEPAPTGVRSFQLCRMLLHLTLHRLACDAVSEQGPEQQASSDATTLSLSQALVEFLENLSAGDCSTFWAPYCPFVITTFSASLIRLSLSAKAASNQPTRTTAGFLLTRLVVALTSAHHNAQWDVASVALDGLAVQLRSLRGNLEELVPLLQLFGEPGKAHTDPRPPPSADSPFHPVSADATTQPSSYATPSATDPLQPTLGSAFPPSTASAPFDLPVGTPSASTADFPAYPSFFSTGNSPDDGLWWMQSEILALPEDLPPALGMGEEGAGMGWEGLLGLSGGTASQGEMGE